VIRDVVAGVHRLTRQGRDGHRIPAPPITGAIDFFTAFIGSCHNPKEEEALFPLLDVDAVPPGLMTQLHADHREEDRLLAALRPLALRQRIDGQAWNVLDTYAALLDRHIASEEHHILPLAERQLSAEQDAALVGAFARIEQRTLGAGGRDVLIALADAVVLAARAVGPPSAHPELVARDIMRARSGAVAPGDSLARAAKLMEALGTRQLPVAAAGRLVGILTRTDMQVYSGHFEWTTVGSAMTAAPRTVGPDTPVRAVARLLAERGFNAVPVVADGEFVGMIARSDALRALAGED
jgi:CBS domain-containing protein